MSRDGRIGVGIIGAGEIADAHLRGYLQAVEHARVTAIADVDPARAQRFTERAGRPEIFVDYRQMIASPLVDAVDICLPHHLHKDAIVAAAEAGKHILCEKTLCLPIEEGEAGTPAVTKAGGTPMCAHKPLFFPNFAAARQVVRDGSMGRGDWAPTTR